MAGLPLQGIHLLGRRLLDLTLGRFRDFPYFDESFIKLICSAICFVAAYAHSGPAPVREFPCRANKSRQKFFLFCLLIQPPMLINPRFFLLFNYVKLCKIYA